MRILDRRGLLSSLAWFWHFWHAARTRTGAHEASELERDFIRTPALDLCARAVSGPGESDARPGTPLGSPLKPGPLLRAMAHRRDPMGYTLKA